VATLNLEKEEIEFQEPTDYIKKIYPEMMYFKNNELNFAVSPDHRMLIKLHQDQKFKFIFADKLPNRCYIKQKDMLWEGLEVKEFLLPKREYIRDIWGTKAIDEPVPVKMEDWLEFLGWFLSDGCLQYNKKASRYINVTITQSDTNKKLPILVDLLNRLPFNYNKAKTDYRFTVRQLIEYLQKYCAKGKKRIPSFVFELSTRLIKCFLKGYFLGDGWLHKGTQYCVFGCHEKKLLDQVQHLILLSGDWATFLECNNVKYNDIRPLVNGKRIIVKSPHFVLTVRRGQYSGILKKQIIKKEYNDFAYCVSVPNQTVYVRRGGHPMWCGNSGQTYSNSGGTGSHLDLRIVDAFNRYVNPNTYLNKLT
jgi:replicative DNA helicase Mcm